MTTAKRNTLGTVLLYIIFAYTLAYGVGVFLIIFGQYLPLLFSSVLLFLVLVVKLAPERLYLWIKAKILNPRRKDRYFVKLYPREGVTRESVVETDANTHQVLNADYTGITAPDITASWDEFTPSIQNDQPVAEEFVPGDADIPQPLLLSDFLYWEEPARIVAVRKDLAGDGHLRAFQQGTNQKTLSIVEALNTFEMGWADDSIVTMIRQKIGDSWSSITVPIYEIEKPTYILFSADNWWKAVREGCGDQNIWDHSTGNKKILAYEEFLSLCPISDHDEVLSNGLRPAIEEISWPMSGPDRVVVTKIPFRGNLNRNIGGPEV